jgi:MFS family permease
MGFLCILSFLTYYDRTCISSISGMIQSDLQLDNLQMGAVFSAFWLAYALLEIPSGFLGDRYGARGTLARIVLAWSAFTALSGSATGFVSLLTYRFLFGVGEAGAYPNMARIQSAWLPVSSRARAGGLLWLTARWGAAFAPFIFGWLMQLFGGDRFHHLLAGTAFAHSAPWRLSFYASGLLGVIWVALFWLWFRDNPAEQRGVNEGELELIRAGTPAASPGSADAPVPGMFASLFSSPSLWALAFLYTCVSFGWSFFVSWMPTFFRSVQGVSMVDSRWMTALPLFFGGISCLAGGALSDWVIQTTGNKRFGRAIFPVIGYTLAAGAMLGVRFTHTPWQATALFCVAAAALDLGQGANWASIVDIGGRYAGSATGFVNMIGNIGGNALQPVLGAWIFTHLGWNALFITYAGTSLAAAGMWFFINPNRRFYREAQPPGQGFEVIMDR